MAPHPFDPLSSQEISKSSKIILDKHPSSTGWIFNSIILVEPPKAELAPKLLKDEKFDFPRKSFTLLIERETGKVFEAIVNITSGVLEKFEQAKACQQPTLTPEDCIESERIVRESLEVQERCRKLGLKDMNLVTADPWFVTILKIFLKTKSKTSLLINQGPLDIMENQSLRTRDLSSFLCTPETLREIIITLIL